MDANKTKKYLDERANQKVNTLLRRETLGDNSQQVVQDIASDLFSSLANEFVVNDDTVNTLKNIQDKTLAKSNEFSVDKANKESKHLDLNVELNLLASKIASLEDELNNLPGGNQNKGKRNSLKAEIKRLQNEEVTKTKQWQNLDKLEIQKIKDITSHVSSLRETYKDIAEKAKIAFNASTVDLVKSSTPHTLEEPNMLNGAQNKTYTVYAGGNKIDTSGNEFSMMINGNKFTIENLKFDETTRKLDTDKIIVKDADGNVAQDGLVIPLEYRASFKTSVNDKTKNGTEQMTFAAQQRVNLQLTTNRLSATDQASALKSKRVKIDQLSSVVYNSFDDVRDTLINEMIDTIAGENVSDEKKRNIRAAVIAHLNNAGFSYDEAAFSDDVVSKDSVLIDVAYKGTKNQLKKDIENKRTSNEILSKVRPFLRKQLEAKFYDGSAAWNTGANTINSVILSSINAGNNIDTAMQQRVLSKHSNRVGDSLNRVFTEHLHGALSEEFSAYIDQFDAGTFTKEQKDQLIAEMVSQYFQQFTMLQFMQDYNNWADNGLTDKSFKGSDQVAYEKKFLEFLRAGTQDSIFTRGKKRLKSWIGDTLENNQALSREIHDHIDRAIREKADPVANLISTTAGNHTVNLLNLYESNRGNFFPAQDEAARRYRGMPGIRNIRRLRDRSFRGGHNINREVVRNVQNNSYMTFFERIDNTQNPESMKDIQLPMGLGSVDISVGLQYHPFQGSLAQNGTVTVNVAGKNVNVGPVERISHGFGLHGMVESVLRHRFHENESVNNVITANVVLAMYKSLVKQAIEKLGELRAGNERISLNKNGNLVFEGRNGHFDEETLRGRNDYNNIFHQLSWLAGGFNYIMQHKNDDYINGVRNRRFNSPGRASLGRSLNPLYRYRNRNLLKNNVEFQCDGIQGTYDKRGRLTLQVQSPEGETIQLPPRSKMKKFTDAVRQTNLEDIFSSPLVYGRQHEILKAFYKAYLERLFQNRRVARHGYWFQHDGRRYAIINRGTPKNQQLSFCEIQAGAPMPGGNRAGVLNQSMVNSLEPVNENIILGNPELMNQFIDVITRRA